jgi:transcriptional regulator with XRE-family HTH domain
MNITERIRHIRESKGLTQEDIAERFNVTRSNYAYLEGRGEKLTIEQLQKIAEALGVSVGELMGNEVGGAKEDTEWFEQRIAELEDRIKDKSLIISKLNAEYTNIFTYLNIFLGHKIVKYALLNSVLDVDKDNERMVFEHNETDSKRWYENYKHSYLNQLASMTDEQIAKVLPLLDRDTDRLIDFAYNTNLIDTRLKTLYVEHLGKHGGGYFVSHSK